MTHQQQFSGGRFLIGILLISAAFMVGLFFSMKAKAQATRTATITFVRPAQYSEL